MQRWVNFDRPGLIYKELSEAVERTHCAVEATFDYWNLRGALAEALEKSRPAPFPDLTRMTPLTDVQMALRWGNNDGRRSMLMEVFSECVVRRSAGSVRVLLETPAGSSAERKELEAIKGANGECQRLAGNLSLKEKAQKFRARLAIALNQMTQASASIQPDAR